MTKKTIGWTAACAIALGLASLSAPAFAQYTTLQNEKLSEAKVNERHSEATGQKCTGAAGVLVCPTVKIAGDAAKLSKLIVDAKGKSLKLKFCVSDRGVPEAVEVAGSTGKPKVDREMTKYVKTWIYNPGTVNGAPARTCDVYSAFNF